MLNEEYDVFCVSFLLIEVFQLDSINPEYLTKSIAYL
jgi:hypothetical protein